MNVFEENQFLRRELAEVRADLAAAEARLHQVEALQQGALTLTDDEAKRILEHPLRLADEAQVHRGR